MSLLLANWKAAAVAAIVLCAFAAGWSVNGGRWETRYARQTAAHEAARARGWESALTKYQEANQRALAAEATIAELRTRAGKTRVIYRDAVKGDPKCAEQASQPLVCPRPW